MNAELRDRSIMVLLLLVAWATLVYLKTVLPPSVLPDLNAIIAQVQVVMGGVVGYHVGTGSAAAQPLASARTPVPSAQGGYTSLPLLFVLGLVAAAVVMVSGCTTTTASVYSGFYTQAKAGVQVFDDNTLNTMHDLLCAQPYSAIQRHPEMQPGLVALCGPLVNVGSLDPSQISLMFSIAKQLNLVPGPQPVPK